MEDRFETVREEFKRRIRAANLTATTDVTLITHGETTQGLQRRPDRLSITPRTNWSGPKAHQNALEDHRSTIIGNIDALVREKPGQDIMALRFELEIRDDAAL